MSDRHTRIICTLGPASAKATTISKMAARGMDIARLNFSHGDHLQHQKMIDRVRKDNETSNATVRILQDLEGYRIRIGHIKKNFILQKDQEIYMSNQKIDDDQTIAIDFNEDIQKIKKGVNIFIDDGKIHLKVVTSEKKEIKT